MTETTSSAVAERATVATRIIRDAGQLALAYFRRYRSLAVETKSGQQDIVSEADRQVETLIREALITSFPEDGLVGEEHGVQKGTSGFTWLIDPIDGTSPFLHGLRTWCVVLALIEKNRPVAGLIYDPSADELFVAVLGQGATMNGAPITVDQSSTLQQGLTAISAVVEVPGAQIAGMIERLHDLGGAYIRLGSAALTLAYVAAGRLVGYFERQLHSWDCVAGLLIVKEAGGTVSVFPLADGPLEIGPAYAASPTVHNPLANLIQAQVFELAPLEVSSSGY
ncbi:inositol monophosphatase family protein [Devosia rhizoryzae]|uniref:Inositol-1-monophosphatase n=1 Tax=Devosia rhizoryzae TaxID=2774137 RepID=A0ABX7C1H8_9HYPH|nr:inositol monophosphatase family protein [Devosia rhizoryzae]QQR38085.1 inositol monophosphatase [Devosia rhizoryzae]